MLILPALKVARTHFSIRVLVREAIRLLAVLLLIAVNGALIEVLTPHFWAGSLLVMMVVGLTVMAFRLGWMDFLGRCLFCVGVVYENLSRTVTARRLYRFALVFLRERTVVYERLRQSSTAASDYLALSALILRR